MNSFSLEATESNMVIEKEEEDPSEKNQAFQNLVGPLVYGLPNVLVWIQLLCRMERKKALAVGVIMVACRVIMEACGGMLLEKAEVDIGVILKEAPDVNVTITLLKSAVAEGAVCLDGSPPAYHFDQGFGSGRDKWVVHLQGGAWCNNIANCLARTKTYLGSSKHMPETREFWGILSKHQRFNPGFYNWNRVYIMYCDGASFMADVEEVDSDTNLHFRGERIFLAVVRELLAKGMNEATNVIFSGCSAGGLANILHCDQFRGLVHPRTKVKCLSDAGYFINVKDISGAPHIEAFYKEVVNTHCFFPQNVAGLVETPLFILNSAIDAWQIQHILAPDTADPGGLWRDCKVNLTKCSTDQLYTIEDFRIKFLAALKELGSSSSRGMFISSCYVHCQIEGQEAWFTNDSPVLDGTTIAEAVGDWYEDRRSFQKIDHCTYPCPETCRNKGSAYIYTTTNVVFYSGAMNASESI